MAVQPTIPSHSPCDPMLFFRIICDPGHERTARELSALDQETRAKVWEDLKGPGLGDGNTGACEEEHSLRHMAEFHKQLQEYQMGMRTSASASTNASSASSTSLSGVQAYLRAVEVDVHDEFVHDPAWIQMFLRAERWDVDKAVERYLRHYQVKASLLMPSHDDPIVLARPWRLSDLHPDDLDVLSTGTHQVLPKKDAAGRMVFVGQLKQLKYKTIKSVLRQISFLFTSSLMRDVDAQRQGVLIVGYEVGEYVSIEREYYRRLFECMRSLPIRVVSAHLCASPDNSPMRHMLELLAHFISPFVRLRLRYHYGSHQECRYRLMTIGIPVDVLPVTPGGDSLLGNHKRWIQYCIEQEAAETEKEIMDDSEMDVE